MKLIGVLFLINAVAAYYKGSVNYGDYEYAYYNDAEDYINRCTASLACPQIPFVPSGSTLAMVKTEDEHNAISVLMEEFGYPHVWLAASDQYEEGYWIWTDGTPVSSGYSHWHSNEPNNDNGNEDCLQLDDTATYWNDKPCGDAAGYVCQIPTNNAYSSDYSVPTFYKREFGVRSYLAAKHECQKVGARLFEITDEHRGMQSLVDEMERNGNEKYWVYIRGSSKCTVLTKDGIEESECDGESNGFICETARPHLLEVTSEKAVVDGGENLEIRCSVSGYPTPDVAWYKSKEMLPNQSIGLASSTLIIKNASKNDGGSYICSATNTIDGNKVKALRISEVTVTPKSDE